MALISVRFLQPFGPHWANAHAGFEPDVAADLVKRGVAVYRDAADKPAEKAPAAPVEVEAAPAVDPEVTLEPEADAEKPKAGRSKRGK